MTRRPARLLAALACLTSAPLAAQAVDSTGSAPAASAVSDSVAGNAPLRAPIASRRDALVAGGIAATAIALVPLDVSIARRLRAPDLQHSKAWRAGAVIFDAYGAPGAMYAGPVLVIAGSVARNAGVADVGIHVSESYAAAALVTFAVKGVAGRARPYAVTDERANSFRFGRGYPHREPFSSFPSGHSTGSFAFASAITVEASQYWPEHARLVGSAAYTCAFLDAVSRVYRDTHWPSDVAAGAFIGTVGGTLVTRYQHAHPSNRLDALARRLTFAPAPAGALLVGASLPF